MLRPEGTVIFRDEADMIGKIKRIAQRMRWKTKTVDHESGPLIGEKILVAVKSYWTGEVNEEQIANVGG